MKKELHIISTGNQPMEQFAEIAGEIKDYVDYFHIREKQQSARQIYEVVKLLIENKVPLSKIIVNDRVDVAWSMKTAGVQLAFHSLEVNVVKQAFPGLRIGCSVHSVEEASFASKMGADYVVYGHLFPTKSKLGLAPRGVKALSVITRQANVPVIAIGGIKPENIGLVLEAGASGIAVMSGVLEAEVPLQAVKDYVEKLK